MSEPLVRASARRSRRLSALVTLVPPVLRASARRSRGLSALVALVALVVAAVPLGIYGWLAGHRLAYPYELDWLESGTVELVARALHGQGLYSPPSLAYVGFTYTPLYSYVAAAVAAVTGVGFLPLRIVSVASSLIIFVTLAAYVRDVVGSWVAGAVAAGVFAACYGLSGQFFDVGRLDSMFLALCLIALWAGRRAGSTRAGVGVGLIAFLAFFTKQVGLIAVGPALLLAVPWRPRMALAALGTLIALAGASTLLLDAATDGWYRYYVVSELAGQPSIQAKILGFWTHDLYANLRQVSWLGGAGLLVSLAAARPWRDPRERWRAWGPAVYDLGALAGCFITAWVSDIHSGGFLNVLMPALAAAAGIAGWAWGRLRGLPRIGPLAALAASALLAWQASNLMPHPQRALPTHRDHVAGAQLIALLRHLPGPVLILRHPWYGTAAGQGAFAQSDGITEVLRSHGPRGARDLRRALAGSLDRFGIRAVLLDNGENPPGWLAPQLRAHFRLVSTHPLSVSLQPPTDINSSPAFLYLRRGAERTSHPRKGPRHDRHRRTAGQRHL
ncbi:MAG TPA: glycosyltransferase 87 family protein [Solirubrobacteraceae bacterium]|nr:glycosyltransferase 87 family protein [Solirubrobacteraceae bacterium]